MYCDDFHYYPPGLLAGVTQWDLCVGSYVGGGKSPYLPSARTPVFNCPSAKVPNARLQSNYSANPNVCKDLWYSNLVMADSFSRSAEILVASDSVQYLGLGGSHAMLWGVKDSEGQNVFWNSGTSGNADKPVAPGIDMDLTLPFTDPTAATFRFRHSAHSLNALFADGHVASLVRGQILERNIYTLY